MVFPDQLNNRALNVLRAKVQFVAGLKDVEFDTRDPRRKIVPLIPIGEALSDRQLGVNFHEPLVNRSD
ncbi:MAG: hypothetical protein K2X73_04695 [Sphingomonas sp.]|nr:hypothetical protein [Sphingomonas sp.]